MLLLISLSLLIWGCSAAYSTCSTNTTCPEGGLWSEWVASENCSSSCGSCSTILHTRECLSDSWSCNCSGNSSIYLLCNTQICTYPAQRTCCIPHVSMLLNGTLQCGPLLKDTSSNTTSCCPVGGVWSSWSGYSRSDDNSGWVRTRLCLSEGAGCLCTGDSSQVQTACPCRSMQLVSSCAGSYEYMALNATVNDTTCEYIAYLRVQNTGSWVPCNARSDGTLTPVIRYVIPSNSSQCVQDRPVSCSDAAAASGWLPISFTCDTSVLYWKYDYTGDYVNGFVQINIVIAS